MHIHKDATVEFTMTEYTFLKSDGEDVMVTVQTTATVIGTLSRSVTCLLYTSPSPRDATLSRMPSSA